MTAKATLANKMQEQFDLAVGLLEDAGAALDLLQGLFVGATPTLLHDLFRGLEMDAPTAPADNHFSLRFSLHNTNNLFAINELEVVCIGEDCNVWRLRTPAAIDPGATVHGACELVPGPGLHKAAEIQVHVKYRMMFWPRSATEYFAWTRAGRQWLRGTLENALSSEPAESIQFQSDGTENHQTQQGGAELFPDSLPQGEPTNTVSWSSDAELTLRHLKLLA